MIFIRKKLPLALFTAQELNHDILVSISRPCVRPICTALSISYSISTFFAKFQKMLKTRKNRKLSVVSCLTHDRIPLKFLHPKWDFWCF